MTVGVGNRPRGEMVGYYASCHSDLQPGLHARDTRWKLSKLGTQLV
jgi:hypothetical protein